jgi:GAF domain-containing protein
VGDRRFTLVDSLARPRRRDALHGVAGHSPWPAGERTPEEVLVPDVGTAPEWSRYATVFRAEAIASLAFLPVFLPGRLLGKFMLYYSEPHSFADAELRIARTIASQVAVAVGSRRARDLGSGSSRRLKALARRAPLDHVLAMLVALVEGQSTEGALASIHVLDAGELVRGASANLPAGRDRGQGRWRGIPA